METAAATRPSSSRTPAALIRTRSRPWSLVRKFRARIHSTTALARRQTPSFSSISSSRTLHSASPWPTEAAATQLCPVRWVFCTRIRVPHLLSGVLSTALPDSSIIRSINQHSPLAYSPLLVALPSSVLHTTSVAFVGLSRGRLLTLIPRFCSLSPLSWWNMSIGALYSRKLAVAAVVSLASPSALSGMHT